MIKKEKIFCEDMRRFLDAEVNKKNIKYYSTKGQELGLTFCGVGLIVEETCMGLYRNEGIKRIVLVGMTPEEYTDYIARDNDKVMESRNNKAFLNQFF